MSEHAVAEAPASAAPQTFWDRHHFLIRRLHSLSGIVPVGAFLFEHLYTSSAILLGPKAYQTDINFIWHLPGLLYLEIFGIWLPIAFHAILGLFYTFGGVKWNPVRYSYQDNWRYVAQRVTGIVAFIYIFCHIATTRWHWNLLGWYTPFEATKATSTTIDAVQHYAWLQWFFAIGLLACVFHFANGLWTAAITWGLTVSVPAQRRWGYVCGAFGLLLFAAGGFSIFTFATLSRGDHAVIEAETAGELRTARPPGPPRDANMPPGMGPGAGRGPGARMGRGPAADRAFVARMAPPTTQPSSPPSPATEKPGADSPAP